MSYIVFEVSKIPCSPFCKIQGAFALLHVVTKETYIFFIYFSLCIFIPASAMSTPILKTANIFITICKLVSTVSMPFVIGKTALVLGPIAVLLYTFSFLLSMDPLAQVFVISYPGWLYEFTITMKNTISKVTFIFFIIWSIPFSLSLP